MDMTTGLLIAFISCVPFIFMGFLRLVEAVHETVMIGKGFVRAELFALNRRAGFKWVKPTKDKKFVIDDMAYDFNDGPDYMVLFSTFLATVPTIYVDCKAHHQIKIFRDKDEIGMNPAVVAGAGKLAYKTGFLEGLGAAMNQKIWFIITYLLIGAVLLLQFPQFKGLTGG